MRCWQRKYCVTWSIWLQIYKINVNKMKKMCKINVKEGAANRIIDHEIVYKHSRSWGHWWQKVNKKETKAEGYFNVVSCHLLNEDQKDWLLKMYHNHISKEWVLRLICQEERSYHHNLEKLKKHFKVLLEMLWEETVFEHFHHHRKRKRH